MKVSFFTFVLLLSFLFLSTDHSTSNAVTTMTQKTLYSTTAVGPLSCVKSSDESFAICASQENKVIRFNLQPFSFVLASTSVGLYLRCCDLYEEAGNTSASVVGILILIVGCLFKNTIKKKQ